MDLAYLHLFNGDNSSFIPSVIKRKINVGKVHTDNIHSPVPSTSAESARTHVMSTNASRTISTRTVTAITPNNTSNAANNISSDAPANNSSDAINTATPTSQI